MLDRIRPHCRCYVFAVLSCAVSLVEIGCGAGAGSSATSGSQISAAAYAGPAVYGTVRAGSTPARGARVQLYAAGAGGNGSPGAPLLSKPLITGADGGFSAAAGAFVCPSPTSLLYAVARGGTVGQSVANPALALMVVLGSCETLGSAKPFVVNELTTVASVYALRPFINAGAQVSASTTNAGGLLLAAHTAARLVDPSTGVAPGPGFPPNGTLPLAKLNTLGNLLHGCLTAPVGATGGASGCAALFAVTSTGGVQPTNTLDALLNLVNQPGTEVPALFAQSLTTSVFVPALDAAPPDWILPVRFRGGGMHGPTSVSINSQGEVWVANYFGVASLFRPDGAPVFPNGFTGNGLQESYGGAVDENDRMWIANEESTNPEVNAGFGSLTLLADNGPALAGQSVFASGGLNTPIAIAFDRQNVAWVVNYGDARLLLFDAEGTPQSGAGGFSSDQFAFPVAIAVDSKRNGWLANQSGDTVTKVSADGKDVTSYVVGSGPSGVGIDAADFVWTANFYGDSLGLVDPRGKVLSGGGLAGGGLHHPVGIAIDGGGAAWVANYRAPGLSEFAGAREAVPGKALSPASGWAPDTGLSEAFGIAIDAAGNVWVSSFGDNYLAEYIGAATPVKTPLLGGVRLP